MTRIRMIRQNIIHNQGQLLQVLLRWLINIRILHPRQLQQHLVQITVQQMPQQHYLKVHQQIPDLHLLVLEVRIPHPDLQQLLNDLKNSRPHRWLDLLLQDMEQRLKGKSFIS